MTKTMTTENNYDDLIEAINGQRWESYVSARRTGDTLALSQIQALINGYPFLPITVASLRPLSLNYLLNDIVINQRTNIIEFGAGVSTILIGRLIKKNGLQTKLLSVEHDMEWIKVLNDILRKEQLDEVARIQPAPLGNCSIAIENNLWYHLEALHQYADQVYDMVIIDGPPAWERGKGSARYPALPFIFDQLKENFSVYLDDADREGEQRIIELWEAKYKISFTVKGDTLACFHGGKSFYMDPFK